MRPQHERDETRDHAQGRGHEGHALVDSELFPELRELEEEGFHPRDSIAGNILPALPAKPVFMQLRSRAPGLRKRPIVREDSPAVKAIAVTSSGDMRASLSNTDATAVPLPPKSTLTEHPNPAFMVAPAVH